ncbi:MAG: O-antigen ligase family protein [Anaerolineae bacterium]|nr:O-antigen ligase family protein [Anaerolineae bacterium]MDW8067376.1 O-antigen ligase family protein [Anaerolineae bacterium]
MKQPLRESTGLLLALATGWLLTRLPLPVAGALAGLTVLVAGTLAEPLVGMGAGIFLGLLRAYLQRDIPQVPAQIGHLFIALALAAHWARGLLGRRLLVPVGREHPASSLFLPVLAFLGVAALSLWNATGPFLDSGLPELIKWAEIGLVLWLVAERTHRRMLPALLGGILAVGLFQAGVGLYQFALWEGPEHFLIPGTPFYRAFGTFEQPNPYAGTIGMVLALMVGVLGVQVVEWARHSFQGLTGQQWVGLAVLAVGSALIGGALVASWSRGAWMGFAAALAAMALALPRKARWGVLLAVGLVGLFLVLYAAGLLPARIAARLTEFAADLRLQDVRGVGINDANYAVIERLAHWQSAVEMWRAHFWTGVGLGGYEPAYPAFALINWPMALGHAHNIYLNILAETGLLGLGVYLFLWGCIFWQTWQTTRRAGGLARGVAVGLLGAWTQLTVHHLVDNLYVNNVHLLVGLLLGLLVVVKTARE